MNYEKINVNELIPSLPETYAQDVRKKVEEKYGVTYSIQTIYNTLFRRVRAKDDVFDCFIEYVDEVKEKRKKSAMLIFKLFGK